MCFIWSHTPIKTHGDSNGNLHECMVDEIPSSWSLQHVVHAVLELSEAFARTRRVDPVRGPPGQRGAQQTCPVRQVSALRAGRFASLRVDGGQSHRLYPPVVARVRGYQHSGATVVWRAS